MPRPTKVVDPDEALELLTHQGYTYAQMVDFYREKYGVETSESIWSRFLKKHLTQGKTSQGRLHQFYLAIPWITPEAVLNNHHRSGLQAMCRMAQGETLTPRLRADAERLQRRLVRENAVVDYDAEARSFVIVPRRPGIDTGWIRDPFRADDGTPRENPPGIRAGARAAHAAGETDGLPPRPDVEEDPYGDEE